MCKFKRVMLVKTILKISIIFISLFIITNKYIVDTEELVEKSVESSYVQREHVPNEVRKVETLPYIESIGKVPLTRPVFKTNIKIEH